MMRRGTARGLVSLAGLLVFAPGASSHRLDELLQAVQVHLFIDHAELEVALTPGINLAPAFLASADTNGDGSVSSLELQEFGTRWLQRVTLTVDGVPLHARITSSTFPSRLELSGGEGIVRMAVRSPDLRKQAGRHQLTIRNDNDPDTSIYLENAVIPSDRRIVIASQTRNATQSVYTVRYEVKASNWLVSLRWFMVTAGAVILLLLQKRLRA